MIPQHPVLQVRHLSVAIENAHGPERLAVADLSFSIGSGQTVAIVGESGSGKTLTARAILGLLDSGTRQAGGTILVGGARLDPGRMLGRRIGAVFQDPVGALNPVRTIGAHLREALHEGGVRSPGTVRSRSLELLEQVGIPDPALRLGQYAHQLSGGLCQRVMIALAVANNPDLLIADEPTTALDATVQAQILRLLREIGTARGMATVIISHDLAIVREIADVVLVMKDGVVVEQGPAAEILENPQHEYTRKLLVASPRMFGELRSLTGRTLWERRSEPSESAEVLIRGRDVRKTYEVTQGFRRRRVEALRGVDFALTKGHAIGIVGESGSGKSTLSRILLGLERPTGGSVELFGTDLSGLSRREVRRLTQQVQTVFQIPHRSLNPRTTIVESMVEPLRVRGVPRAEWDEQVRHYLGLVHFDPDRLGAYPHQLSGGQCQRVAIARALAAQPRALVLDEPTSALDVSIQAQIIDLLRELQAELELSYVFITHDLAVVRYVADTIVVVHQGEVVESGPTQLILEQPQSGYTRKLISSTPDGAAHLAASGAQ